MSALSPWLKTPFTDLTGNVLSHQWDGRCKDMEMRAVDCLEAYGLDKGNRVCADLMRDFSECSLRLKESKRILVMQEERERQYRAGERSRENRYAPGPRDESY